MQFPPFAPGAFEDFDDAKGYPTIEEAKKLLARVGGEPYEIAEARKGERTIRRFSGLMRLAQAWPEGAALRIGVLEPAQFQIHLWSGATGVTLRYYPESYPTWAAYATTREGGKPRPASSVLMGTAGDRYRRSGLGTFELHCRGGKLWMVRGDLVLLSVPLSAPPAEVLFEGSGLLRGMAVGEAKWAPPPAEPPRKAVVQSDRPAELPWEATAVEGVVLNRLPDGRVELAAGEKTQPGQASFALDEPGLYEILIEVEDAEPGTGIFLGNAEGAHLGRVVFLRHHETGKTVFELAANWANETEKSYDPNKQPIAWSGKRQWLRLVCTPGVVRCFTSGDGAFWSPVSPAGLGIDGACRRIGLYCLAGQGKRSIKLRSIEVRPLAALASTVPAAVRAHAPALAKATSLAAWRQQAIEARPDDTPWETWWRACAARTLSEGPKPPLAQPLLDRLAQAAMEEDAPVERRLELLEELSYCYGAEDWNSYDRLMRHVERLGRGLMDRGHPAPFTVLSRAMMRLPFWHQRRLPVFPELLLRHELFARIGANRAQDVRELAARLRYWNGRGLREGEPLLTPHGEQLLAWAELQIAAGPARSPDRKLLPRGFARHPLLEQISREAYNTVAEFRAAVDGRTYREACQIITSISDPDALGLSADRQDPRLLVSFPLAVDLAMRDDPALRKTMDEKFGAIGRLRIKQAAVVGDARAMEMVAQQFPGTEVAAEARRWLGDRGLSGGRFVEALSHYREALALAAPADRESLAARCRLAGAMLGLDLGRPAKSGVQLGATWLPAAEFEQMVQQVRQAHTPATADSAAAPAAFGLLPGRYEVRPWAKLEQRQVNRPPGVPERGIDWQGEQTAVAIAGKQMLISNRLDTVALNLQAGQLQWTQRAIVPPEAAVQWPLAPMAPVGVGGKIFVRRAAKEGPELACLEAADGKVLWSNKPDGAVVSDPLFVGPRLFVLTAASDGADKLTLALVELTPGSGRVRSRAVLAEFRDVWHRQFPCEATAIEDRIVANAGGSVLACEASGRVRWVRREIWGPPPGGDSAGARSWFDQARQQPLVAGDKIFVAQPGVAGIECLDLETGRLIWRRPLGTLVRIVGPTPKRLIVETLDGLAGLDGTSGQVLWSRPTPECLDVRRCGPSGPIVMAHVGPKKEPGAPASVALSWFDAETGRTLGTSILGTPPHPQPWFKPLVAAHARQWALFGTAQTQGREVLELVRVGDLENLPSEAAFP